MPKVIVGMSGGVDSSVTAYLLKEKGYEVEGLSFLMWDETGETAPACCSYKAMDEVSGIARHLGISHSIIDVRSDFREKVIEPFVRAYISGLTPNPCVLCNRFIKFPSLLKEAGKRGVGFIATGHYARIESNQQQGRFSVIPPAPPLVKGGKGGFENFTDFYFLRKGIDSKKDQSYVLHMLDQDILKRLILPLGYCKKEEVRGIARGLGLPSAERSESQEICFIEDRNYLKFIDKLFPVAGMSGPIVNLNGKVIGTHKGVCGYTIGQRKGMGIASPEPLYVVNIDTQSNTIYAGPREAAQKQEIFVEDINWIVPIIPPLVRDDNDGLNFRASVKVRSTMQDQPATIHLGAMSKEQGARDVVHVVFDEPQWAPAPGQSAVFYNGDTVIGGGLIKKSV
ncbi:MAG: tRNA 2-thiouridine(34) synthase MnmA [Thermodesulfovibrionales bacterium]